MDNKSATQFDKAVAILGLLIASPAIYFFMGSLFKYEFNLLQTTEILVPPPIVMISGLLLAAAMNAYILFRTHKNTGSAFIFLIKTQPLNFFVLFIAFSILVLLLSYVAVENALNH